MIQKSEFQLIARRRFNGRETDLDQVYTDHDSALRVNSFRICLAILGDDNWQNLIKRLCITAKSVLGRYKAWLLQMRLMKALFNFLGVASESSANPNCLQHFRQNLGFEQDFSGINYAQSINLFTPDSDCKFATFLEATRVAL